jgi:hypothetical protein
MKMLLLEYPNLGAILSISATISSFIAVALPILQFIGVVSGIFIGWYTFYLQRKQNKK